MRQLLCSTFVTLLFASQVLAQCSPGTAVFRETLCCGEYIDHYSCMGSDGQCDPINTWRECGNGCSVGNAGCGIGNAQPKTAIVSALDSLRRPAGRFNESACGRGFNDWLDGKLAAKNNVQRTSVAGQ